MPKTIDRTGRQYGFLTAIEPTHKALSSGRRMSATRLRCECGNEVVAMNTNLDKGHHQSCGCQRGAAIAAHYPGDTKRPEYSVYRQMLDRCYLKTAPNYPWYGAKGVTVCDRWRRGTNQLTGFQCFFADMGERPVGLTLERKDPRLPYAPGNCCWATWKEQAANKREHYASPEELQRIRDARAAPRKLTPAMRQTILARLKGGEKQWPIARSMGLSQTTVSYVKLGQR